jgi:zinc D-Ala-D-Ala carboxypeptidase
MITIEEAKAYRLSNNFTLYEFLHSETAIMHGLMDKQCQISETSIENLKKLCVNVLQPLRDYLKVPIAINSGYRSKELNAIIKGSITSEHMEGKAADIKTSKMIEAWKFIPRLNFRQAIKYGNYRFIHVSYNEIDNKRQILEFTP